MNCPRCNVQIPFKKTRCDHCGQDLVTYRKIVSVSNMYYNDGLARAKVRDLSGAITSLQKSLQFNKGNTNARNLLGLIYYEMGEIVSALSEWVISKYFQGEGNEADDYINTIQSNPNKLDSVNQTIKKYNAALNSAKHGDEDMAIIQLKKVVSTNPKFIRAHQLLALLYMQTADQDERNNERAIKLLKKIRRVDVNNTVTLKYLKELGISPQPQARKTTAGVASEALGSRKSLPKDDTATFAPVSGFPDERPGIMPWVNLIIGIVVGLAVSYFLIFPQVSSNMSSEDSKKFKSLSEQVAELNSTKSSLENDKKDLNAQIAELQGQVEKMKGDDPETVSKLEDKYKTLLEAFALYQKNSYREAADTLSAIKEEDLGIKEAKDMYKQIKDATFENASQEYYNQGETAFAGEGDYAGVPDYDAAIKALKKAIKLKEDNVDAIYYMGRCYQQKGDMDKAKKYYQQITSDFASNARAADAQARLDEIAAAN